MNNKSLGEDYLQRAQVRLGSIEYLFSHKSWADVIRESQEVVELVLKGLLRLSNVAPPRTHEVSEVLLEVQDKLPHELIPHLDEVVRISRSLRRDRELSFYGSEDLTPSEFYKESDAVEAKTQASWLVKTVVESLG